MIINHTKKKIIIKKSKLCKSVICKAIGFMFRKKNPDYALIFIFRNERKNPLHMLFVFFPIDVLFLDKKKQVVEIKKDFKPFTYYSPKNKSLYVIELPTGHLKITRKGDKIRF